MTRVTNRSTASIESNEIKSENKCLSFIRVNVEAADRSKVVKDSWGILIGDYKRT